MFIFFGCQSDSSSKNIKSNVKENEAKPEDFNNNISDIIATFSSLVAADGVWDEGYDEETKKSAFLIPVENDRLSWCYDTMDPLKLEIYGSIYKATIEIINEGEVNVLYTDKNIDGSFVIASDDFSNIYSGKLVIKSQDEVLAEVIIEQEGCL